MTKKMYWFNEPDTWETMGNSSLAMKVTPKTDYWRQTHYGFTIDDGPFYYVMMGGEFEARVKISGAFKNQYDQMGLMIRKNKKRWIKSGAEFVDGKVHLSTVVTNRFSDWSLVELEKVPKTIWLKAIRRLDSLKLYHSLDGKNFTLGRLAYFPNNSPVMVGIMAASPDGDGFNAVFEDFVLKQLPDQKRMEWSNNS